jgi:hypothetical protein
VNEPMQDILRRLDREFPANPHAEALAEFRRMCEAHDIFYVYADGAPYWKGKQTERQILEFIPRIGKANAARIWNETVDKKCAVHERARWYWSEE